MSLPDDLEQNLPDSSKAENPKKPRRKRSAAAAPPPPPPTDFWADLPSSSVDDAIPDWLKADLDSNETHESLPDWLQPPSSAAALEEDELPSWLKTPIPDGRAGKNAQRSDDWETTNLLPPSSPTEEAPEELEWLDQLSSEKGMLLDEFPTLSWEVEANAGSSAANDLSWLDELSQQHPPQKESEPDLDWLTAIPSSPPIAEITPTPFSQESTEQPTGSLFTEDVPDDLDAAMAWLEKLAARQGASLDELPTITEIPSGYEPIIAQEKPITPTIEPPPLLVESASATLPGSDIPDDPEAMMAWLEQLAARQGAPLEELPSISATASSSYEPAVDEFAAADIPDDPEAAMAWLEQLAARQGAPLEELPTITQTPVESTQPAETAIESISLEEFTSQIPDDPEAAMAWLEQLAARKRAPLEELPTTPPPVAEQLVSPSAPVDLPDDLDAAMAWLEQLAARQGAPLEELPTVPEKPTDITMPAWLLEMPASPPPTVVFDPDIPRDSDSLWLWLVDLALIEDDEPVMVAATTADELPDWLEEKMPAQIAASPEPTPTVDLAMPEELSTQDIADSLPDWLSLDTIQDISWLDSLPATSGDPDSWLVSEEQAATQFEQRVELAEIESLLEPVVLYSVPEVTEEQVSTKVTAKSQMPALSPTTTEPEAELLNNARQALSTGDYATAIQNYEKLVRAGNGLPTLIADLEAASNRYHRQPLLRRLLGDAYMSHGDLQKALGNYRQVLNIL